MRLQSKGRFLVSHIAARVIHPGLVYAVAVGAGSKGDERKDDRLALFGFSTPRADANKALNGKSSNVRAAKVTTQVDRLKAFRA